jgi:hypothetical protein
MGTSNWQNISYCVGMLRRLKPTSVLDVGTGFGRWGVLCREFLDVWEGREARSLWQARIEGIEAFPACLTPLHGYVYDRLHVGDAVDLLPTLGTYDVVYLGDVVEHQTKLRAWALLDEAVRHARQAAIVTIPIGDNWPQEMGWDGNSYHAHRSVWEPEDFDRYPGARRHAFSDFLGRMYLVAELPGQADEVFRGAMPAPDIVCVAPKASTNDCGGLPPELLNRLDENLSCRALADNPGLDIDLSGALLFQLPATAEIQRCLAQLESERLPWASPLAATVDSLFKHCVAAEAARAPGSRDLSPPAHLLELLERFAAAMSSLAEHAHARPEILREAVRT